MDFCAANTTTPWTWTPITEAEETEKKTQQDKHQTVQNDFPVQSAHLSTLALCSGTTTKTSNKCNGQAYIAATGKTQQQWTRDCLQGLRRPGNPACDGTPVPQQLDHFQGLRPPGNPKIDDDHLHTALTITEHGRYLLDVIVQHISYEITAHQIREKILSAARLLQTMPTPVKNDKPPPVVLELDKALFHTADPCTAHLRSDMPKAHADKVTQPRLKEGASQASIEGFGEFRVFVGDDALDDDDGLIVSWPSLPYRNPLEFLEDLPEEFATVLRNYDDATDQHDDYLHIYTDGSAGWFDGDKRSSWAFIVFKSKDSTPNTQNMAFVDWFGNITQEDPMSPDWTGALEHSSRSGEAEAIAWAILWSLQRHPPCHIVIHSDATSVLHATTGQWNFPDDDYLLLRVRALYKVLWTLMTDEYVDIKHVQAHAGYAGNEIVDLIAKKICARQEDARTPSISLAKWMHGHPPLIEWAWTMVDNLYRDGEVPRYEDRHFKWTMWRRPDMQLQWLPNIPPANCVTKDTSQLCCTIAGYNVGSLKEAAKSAYLRQQLQFYKIAIAALQETRVAYEDAPDSNYMRFIAKANSGIRGCELWISLTLPYNGSEQHPRYFQRKIFQALVAEPQLLLVACDVDELRLLFVTAHAPHQGTGHDKVSMWWENLSRLLSDYGRGRHIVLCIDANARPETTIPHVGHLGEHEGGLPAQCFVSLLQHHDLFLPSTYPDIHHGPVETWRSNDARYAARIDYIAVPLSWQPFAMRSQVHQHLDSGTAGLDHQAVTLQLNGVWVGRSQVQPRPKFDREKISQATPETWKQLFSCWPQVQWEVDPSTHAAVIEAELHRRLEEHFPITRKRKRNTIQFSDALWNIFATRNHLRKALSAHRKAHEMLLQWMSLHSWKCNGQYYPLQVEAIKYVLRIAMVWRRHQQHNTLIKTTLANERADFLQQMS